MRAAAKPGGSTFELWQSTHDELRGGAISQDSLRPLRPLPLARPPSGPDQASRAVAKRARANVDSPGACHEHVCAVVLFRPGLLAVASDMGSTQDKFSAQKHLMPGVLEQRNRVGQGAKVYLRHCRQGYDSQRTSMRQSIRSDRGRRIRSPQTAPRPHRPHRPQQGRAKVSDSS